MKRVLSVVLSIILVMALFAGCANTSGGSTAPESSAAENEPQASSSGEAYDLVFWVYSDATMNEQGRLMTEWADAFCAENDDVNSITFVAKSDSELLTNIMAGVGLPDCMFSAYSYGKEYMDAIDLINLKDMYDSDPDYTAGFYPEALEACTTEDGMWCIPFISYVPCIYRNLDILEAAGIDPADGEATVNDFLAHLKAVTDAGYQATHSWSASSYCGKTILCADWSNLTPGIENNKTTLQASQITRTLETMLAINEYGNNWSNWDTAAVEAFKTNELAYLLDGPWSEPGFQEAGVNYDVALFPPYEVGGNPGNPAGWDCMYGIDSGDEARNDAIIRWLKCLGESEHMGDWTLYVGRPTLRADVMSNPDYIQSEMCKSQAEGMKNIVLVSQYFQYSWDWTSPFSTVLPNVADGSMTVEEGSEDFIKLLNELYAENG